MSGQPSSNLQLFCHSERVSEAPVVALALRPDSDPWFLLEHALDWANRLGARLDLCSVLPGHGDLSTTELSPLHDRYFGRKRHLRAKSWLGRLMDAVPVHRRGSITVLEGEAGTALAEYAQNHALLVLGRSRRKGFLSIFDRGVGAQLAQISPVPVAIVGGRRLRPQVVAMAPLSPTDPSLDAVQWLAAHLPGSQLDTVSVADREDPLSRPRADLVARLPGTRGRPTSLRVRSFTLRGIGRRLARRASSLSADLVAVPASSRTGLVRWVFGSVVDGLVQSCQCTLLVVPRSDHHPHRLATR